MADYKGTNLLSDQELLLIKENLRQTRDWLEKRNISLELLVIPNLHPLEMQKKAVNPCPLLHLDGARFKNNRSEE